ncbi:MAG TPA: hypothetical protein DHW82_12525, partial [Spirochaetia bacterium]|nr:hypothetical protein [Spirochaetia bacterium]
MKKKLLLLLFFITALISCKKEKTSEPSSESNQKLPITLWAKGALSSSNNLIYIASVSDKNGNIYSAGNITGSGIVDFGNGVKVSGSAPNSSNLLLTKYNSSGEIEWAKSVISEEKSSSEYNFVEIDRSGNIYVIGSTGGGNYDFGNNIKLNIDASTNNK